MAGVPRLSKAEGIAVARLSGAAMRHAAGQGDRDPAGRDGPVAELHAISSDPRLLGMAAAAHTVDPTTLDRRAAELLRQAGADEDVLAEHAEQVREWVRSARAEPGGQGSSGSSS